MTDLVQAIPKTENEKHNQEMEAASIATIETRSSTLLQKDRLSSMWTIAFSGIALASDGYQNSVMSLANVVLKKQFGATNYSSVVSTRVSNSLLVGAILGQLIIGVVVDRIGRKTGLVVTTLMIVLGSALATASSPVSNPYGLLWMLTIARGITGVGVGGEYPASSASAQEAANEGTVTKRRGATFIMVTNFVLVFGGTISICVFLVLLSIFGENNPEPVWRLAFGIGTLLPLTVMYFRLKIAMSKLYREGAMRKNVPYVLIVKKYWKRLIGTAGTWFLYDIIVFPNNLFSATIINSAVKNGSVIRTAEWQLLISAIALPGVIFGAFLVERIGRRKTLMMGFTGFMIMGIIIGTSFNKLNEHGLIGAFVVLYGLFVFFGNAGPGDVEGLIASESYPSSIRGTCYGISAALGKTGAAIGTAAFNPLALAAGQYMTFIVCALLALIGILLTYFFVIEMKDVDLHREDEEFKQYLKEQGYKGEVGYGDNAVAINAKIDQVAVDKAEKA